MLVSTWLSNVAFHVLPKWLVKIGSESCQTLFPSGFRMPPSEVAVLFNLSLSRSPSVRQVVDLDLLLCTGLDSEHAYSETTASDQ